MPSIFPHPVSLDELNKMSHGNMGEWLDIRFDEVGEDYITASMPVDHRTKQPFGVLHGGASVALAETVASICANAVLPAAENMYAVGLEINANHIKAVPGGRVHATCKALQLGTKFSVWEIRITNDSEVLTCICRMTAAILKRNPNKQGQAPT